MIARKIIIFSLVFLFPFLTFGEFYRFEVSYPQIGNIRLGEKIIIDKEIGDYIGYFYQISIIFGVILALFSLILGATLYIISVGNIGRQSSARERIQSSLFGLLLLLSSFLILRTIGTEFVNIGLPFLKLTSIEIESGVWICPENISVTYELGGATSTLTFEDYIESKEYIWLNWENIPNELQRGIRDLYITVHSKCYLIKVSQELPKEVRKFRWIYIVGNYGAIFHYLPKFKGPIRLAALEFRPYFNGFDPPNQVDHVGASTGDYFNFVIPEGYPPFFSVTLFRDYRLDFVDTQYIKSGGSLSKAIEHFNPNPSFSLTGTTTFYTFRNFHEDVRDEYRAPTSICPSYATSTNSVASTTQPCFKTFVFNIEDFIKKISPEEPLIEKYFDLFATDTVLSIKLDPCYSLKIEPEKEEEKRNWIVVAPGSISERWVDFSLSLLTNPSSLAYNFIELVKDVKNWGEVLNEEDRNLEDNYISYFCQDKATQKRYPCFNKVLILPGKIIKAGRKE